MSVSLTANPPEQPTTFPQETWDWAEKKAKEIRKQRGRRKINLAEGLYSCPLPYGFRANIESGNWAPWPHETKTVNCQTAASNLYVVAKKLGLNPRMYALVGIRNPGGPHGSLHFTVDVDVGATRRVVVDPLQEIFGYYKVEGNSIKIVRDNDTTRDLVKEFSSMFPVSEEEYAEKLRFQRTPQGSLTMLLEGQKIEKYHCDRWRSNTFWLGSWFVRYNPEHRLLWARINFDRPLIQHRVLTLVTELDENIAVKARTISFDYARDTYWFNPQDPTFLAEFDWEDMRHLVPLLRKMKRNDQRSLEQLVRSHVRNELSLSPEGGSTQSLSASDKVDHAANLLLQLIQKVRDPSFRTRYANTANLREISMVVAEAAYQRECTGKDSVFSIDEMRKFCVEKLDEWKDQMPSMDDFGYACRLHAFGLVKTPGVWDRLRKKRRRIRKLEDAFTEIARLHKWEPRDRFAAIVDRYLFAERVLKEQYPSHADFSDQELFAAYAGMFTEFAVMASGSAKLLTLKGLEEKILEKIKRAGDPALCDKEDIGAVKIVVPDRKDLGTTEAEEKPLLCSKCGGALEGAPLEESL